MLTHFVADLPAPARPEEPLLSICIATYKRAMYIGATLEAILAQRLVRRICTKCRTPYEPPATLLQQLNIDPIDIGKREFFYGKGCEHCSNSGYRGRMGIYEWLRMSEGIRDLVVNRAPTLVVKQKALEQGMRTLRDDGLRAIFDGATSIEEVVKYT